ncbi:MAG: potassium channel family protein [Actinomycetota bacterium]|nr:potassium channel family protein [Actinomycetota bacterium]
MPWAVTGAGALVVLVVLRDIFHTLLHPSGRGQLSLALTRIAWFLARRSGTVGMRLAGPLAMLAVISTWAVLTILGWAMIYLPHLPTSFSYGPGLDPARRSVLADALYLSLVVGATLGFGDIVPVSGWLRLATPLEALMGFALFTASVTWILQIYPALATRRALAIRLRLLAERGAQAVDLPPSVLHGLAADIVAVRVDLQQYNLTYYFHDGHETSLAAALPAALALGDDAAGATDGERRLAGAALRSALEDLTVLLDRQYLRTAGTPEEVITAYGRDHHQA